MYFFVKIIIGFKVTATLNLLVKVNLARGVTAVASKVITRWEILPFRYGLHLRLPVERV